VVNGIRLQGEGAGPEKGGFQPRNRHPALRFRWKAGATSLATDLV